MEPSFTTSPRWSSTTKLLVGLVVVGIVAFLLFRLTSLITPLMIVFILAYLLKPVEGLRQYSLLCYPHPFDRPAYPGWRRIGDSGAKPDPASAGDCCRSPQLYPKSRWTSLSDRAFYVGYADDRS